MSTAEVTATIGILRALILSQKDPTKIHELLKDYREMEGAPIPFKKFGYSSIEAFLKSSNEFSLISIHGESCVTARPNKESAHISNMIANQRSTRRRRRPTKFGSFRQPRLSNQVWNKSLYSSTVYHGLNQNNSKRYGNNAGNYRFQGDSNNNITQNNNRTAQQNFRNIIPQQQSNNSFNAKSQSFKENEFDLRDKINLKKQSKLNTDLRIKLDAKKMEIPSLLDLKVTKPSDDNLNKISNLKIEISNNPFNKKHTKRNVTAENGTSKRISVQDRLNIRQQTASEILLPDLTASIPTSLSTPSTPKIEKSKQKIIDNEAESRVVPNIENKAVNKAIVKKSPNFQFDNSLTPIKALEEYCIFHNFEIPAYIKIKPKFSKQIQCRVNINGVMYSTYPNEYNNEETAEVACAKIAIDDIKFSMSNRNCYPVWPNSDHELASKIYDDIQQNHLHGIFVKSLPKIFEESFKIALPDHWISVINDSNLFSMEDTAGGDKIVFINKNTEIETRVEDINLIEFGDELKLPWDEKYWNLYVTNCLSTVAIWARIVGPEYSKRLDSLLNEIELSMLTDMQRPSSITTGSYYLVCLSECWHRVRLERIDKVKGTCHCFFIDFGDEDEVPLEKLHICDSKFLQLPPQAIVFSLFGLEDFAENPIAKQHLIEILMGKSLVAEIETKKDVFDKYTCATSINTYNLSLKIPKIQIVLYDTSDPIDDINLNPLILKKICDETPPPELKLGLLTNVTFTHISDEGDIFLQIRSSALFSIQKLINQIVESEFNEIQNRITSRDILSPNIFLIKDNEDNKWYRGCFVQNKRESIDENYEIFYVDFGITKKTHISQIFKLEALSAALSKYPKQSIKAKLCDIPNISKTIVGRIRAVLPINYPAIAKLVNLKLDENDNLVPYILAYVRYEHNSSLCNVNETLQIEHELESSSEINIQNFNQMFVTNCESNNDKPKSILTIKKNIVKSPIPEQSTPAVGEYFNVFVTVSSNPYNFLVRPYDNFPNFKLDMNKLREYFFKRRDEYILNDMIQIGEVYAYVADDGICSRVEVEGRYSSQMSCVVRIDYGDIIIVNNNQLRILPEQFRKIPQQALKAKLYGIKPIDVDWTTEDCLRFRELTVGQKFAALIKNVSFDNSTLKLNSTKVLELQLIDVRTVDDVYIDKIFVDENRATFTS